VVEGGESFNMDFSPFFIKIFWNIFYYIIFIDEKDYMDINSWIKINYNQVEQTIRNITKNNGDTDDFIQEMMIMILKNKKINTVPDNEKLYYIIKICKNNYHSNTSPFRYKREKEKKILTEIKPELYKIPQDDNEYPTWEWVEQQLEKYDWFHRDLFLLWAELGSITKVHKETQIPMNSVGRYIKKIKADLLINWKKQQ